MSSSDYMQYVKRWNWSTDKPEPGKECTLSEAGLNWLVEDIATGDQYTILDVFSKNARVRRPDHTIQLLDGSRRIRIVSLKVEDERVKIGDVIQILPPSKHAGLIGVVAKGGGRRSIAIPGREGLLSVDASFMVKLPGTWELTSKDVV